MRVPSQLLFFDLDDTLLDHRGAEEAALRETYEAHASLFGGVSFPQWFPRYRAWNEALWAGFARGDVSREELKARRFAEPLAELALDAALADALSRFYLAAYERRWALNEGAEEILEDASRLGVVGVLSNGFVEIQRAKLKRFALERWVRHVVLSEEVGAMKPAREIFDAAWRAAAGGAAVRKVYVGDSFETDVLGAKGAGWLPVLFDPEARGAPAPVLWVRRLVDLKPLLS